MENIRCRLSRTGRTGRANAVLSGGHPAARPPPDTGPTVQWPTPAQPAGAAGRVLLGLTGLSVAGR
ncbi:MAG: hypothetical protein ACLS43_07990 [Evtepia gabavorous]